MESSGSPSIPRSAIRNPHSDEVHVFRLQRSRRVPTTQATEPTANTEKTAASPHDSELETRNPEPPATPFLGFTYLGTSPEHYHLNAPDERRVNTHAALRREQIRELARKGLPASIIQALVGPDETAKRKAKTLIDGLMDGSYLKYLNS